VISDTHGLLRPEAVTAIQGSELIIHAGDVGKPEVLTALRETAAVVAVRGNVDRGPWSEALPQRAVVDAHHARILVLHDLKELDLDPATAGFQIVVTGHTHKPASFKRAGVLFLNPGAAGPRRFNLPVTVATLNLGRNPCDVRIVNVLDAPMP